MFKHGSILVKSGKIIKIGHNNRGFNKFSNRFRNDGIAGTQHAELRSILGLDYSITRNSILYVMRINKNGEFRNSKPCNMCQNICRFVGVKRIIYTVNNEYVDIIEL